MRIRSKLALILFGMILGALSYRGPELAFCRPRTRCDLASRCRRRHWSSEMGK